MKSLIAVFILTTLVSAQCDRRCLRCNADGVSCDVCNSYLRYFNTGYGVGGTCRAIFIEGCDTIDNNGQCLKCSSTDFVPYGGVCKAGITSGNCVSYSHLGTCEFCADGFYPSTGGCVPVGQDLISQCRVYNGPRNCRLCNAGYYPYGGECRASLPNCLAATGPTCRQCNDGYFLQTNTFNAYSNFIDNYYYAQNYNSFPYESFRCVPAGVQNCAVYQSANVCLTCNGGYYLTNGYCVRANTIVNCLSYASATRCATCANGFFVTTDGLCAAPTGTTTANCLYYNAGFVCAQCATGYYLSVANGVTTCVSLAATAIANCAVYGYSAALNQVVCLQCTGSFVLNAAGTACAAIVLTVPNCVVYGANNACLFCDNGFYLAAGACAAVTTVIADCVRYSANGVCSQCAATAYLSNNACVARASTIVGCNVYATASTCLYCAAGYFVTPNGLCTSFAGVGIPNCIRYSGSAAVCSLCATGFALNAAGTACTPVVTANLCDYTGINDLCIYCQQNQYYNAATNTCITVPANALIAGCYYYSSATACAQCQTNYYLASATSCVLKGNSNVPVYNVAWPQGARFFDSQGASLCSSLYFLTVDANGFKYCTQVDTIRNGVSVPIAGCGVYASQTSCLYCSTGTLRDVTARAAENQGYTNLCVQVPAVANCDYYGATTITYNAVANQLLQPVVSVVCLQCKSGFYLNNGVTPVACVAIVPAQTITNCIVYADQTAVVATAISCKLCAAGFYASGNTCVAAVGSAVANCAVYASATLCSICSNGFYYNSAANTCVAVTAAIANCVRYSAAATCAECASGFYLASNACVALAVSVPNCLSFASATTCLLCNAGFFLNNGACAAITAQIANCAVYATATTCRYCQNGLAVSADGTQCVSQGAIISVANCYAFDAAGVCSLCAGGFYLQNTGTAAAPVYVCTAVTAAIAGCSYYASQTTCAVCQAGFTLSNNRAACVANCLVASDTGCQACLGGFSPVNGVCTAFPANTALIANCEAYSAVGTCYACGSGYILSVDGTVCAATTALSNCKYLVDTAQQCLFCAPSYYPVNGVCTAGTASSGVGCLYTANGNPATCDICNFGYYQSTFNGPCTAINPNLNYYLERNSVGILFLFSQLLAILFFM